MSQSPPVFVIVPGSPFNPSHYGYLQHLLMEAGYGALSGLLPSCGSLDGAEVTIDDDARYIRDRMVRPILENEQRDVIIVGHSYSSIPASAAVAGLSKRQRAAAGEKHGVVGQIHVAGVLIEGGTGMSIHASAEAKNLMSTGGLIPALLDDVEPRLAAGAERSAVHSSFTITKSPLPRPSWHEPGYRARLAYIKTTKDLAIPVESQELQLANSGVRWLIKEINSSHSACLSQPKELAELIVELARGFDAVLKED